MSHSDIKSPNQLASILRDSAEATTVMRFYRPTCPACEASQKPWMDLASQKASPHRKFVSVNVVDNSALANRFHIDRIPTFIITKNGQAAKKIVGANVDDLREVI